MTTRKKKEANNRLRINHKKKIISHKNKPKKKHTIFTTGEIKIIY